MSGYSRKLVTCHGVSVVSAANAYIKYCVLHALEANFHVIFNGLLLDIFMSPILTQTGDRVSETEKHVWPSVPCSEPSCYSC